MAKKNVSIDVAIKELEQIEEEFGALSNGPREIVLDAIQRGNIIFDSSKNEITYFLQKPITLDNGKQFEEVLFYEPDLKTMNMVSKGLKITANDKKEFKLDADAQRQTMTRLVTVMTGQPIGVIERIVRRDVAVLESLSYFFA